MLLTLNENCLTRICDFLSLEDQITLSRVCEFLKDFFEKNFWSWKCKEIGLKNPFWDIQENEEYIPRLLRITAASVKIVSLHSKHIEKYGKVLLALKFPKVQSCEATIYKDEQMLKITQMFPNIKCLDVDGYFSGQYISLLKDLEELCLASRTNTPLYCFPDVYNLPNFKKITFIDNMRNHYSSFPNAIKMAQYSTTLEEIGFNEYVWCPSMEILKKMKQLRVINLRVSSDCTQMSHQMNTIFKGIENIFMDAIETLVLHKIKLYELPHGRIPNLIFLRSMIIFKSIIPDNVVEQLCRNLPEALEEFYFLYNSAQLEESASKFLPLITKCLELTLFDVSGCSVAKNFIADIASVVKFQNRKKPLVLRCFQTNVSKQSLQNLSFPANFEVSFSKGAYNFYECNFPFFQLHLNRSKIKEPEDSDTEYHEDSDNYYYDDVSSRDVDCCYSYGDD